MAASLNSSELSSVSNVLTQPADQYGNDPVVEMHWAMKTYHHAETYFNLLISVDPALLKLTKIDDEIYTTFREDFPDYPINKLSDDELKSEKSKQEWREYFKKFEGRVNDFNMGTLIRLDASEDITDKNTTLVPRIQFLTIEIARNREGLNSGLRNKFRPQKSAESAAS